MSQADFLAPPWGWRSASIWLLIFIILFRGFVRRVVGGCGFPFPILMGGDRPGLAAARPDLSSRGACGAGPSEGNACSTQQYPVTVPLIYGTQPAALGLLFSVLEPHLRRAGALRSPRANETLALGSMATFPLKALSQSPLSSSSTATLHGSVPLLSSPCTSSSSAFRRGISPPV
jgi:hypothetical protein